MPATHQALAGHCVCVTATVEDRAAEPSLRLRSEQKKKKKHHTWEGREMGAGALSESALVRKVYRSTAPIPLHVSYVSFSSTNGGGGIWAAGHRAAIVARLKLLPPVPQPPAWLITALQHLPRAKHST